MALLHQLAGDIVDGGDVVRVHRVTQAQGIGQGGGAEQNRMIVERRQGPQPSGQIRQQQGGV